MIQYENPMARPLTRSEKIQLWGDASQPTEFDKALASLTDDPDSCFIDAEVGWYEGEQEILGRIVMLAADAYANSSDNREAILRTVEELGELLMRNRAKGPEWAKEHERCHAAQARRLA